MRFTTAILALAATTSATLQAVQNQCHESVWLTFANTTNTTAPEELPSGEAYVTNLNGTGNSLGVTKNKGDYQSTDGYKLILGSSLADALLYWTINSVNGDPFAEESFNCNVTGADPATLGQNATTYEPGVVKVAQDPQDNLTLTLWLCP
ncbi:MOSC-domain-containing protein [Teratosphaeria destructans]|uniref:MOSC-domain-containing protein n=1 Tax=Teratosphaeria destructans TaxID=418781 RepID=A0A9W7SNC8_9PEZI|nr:MOSC-domain-containing protein [Teratosphaeria destructans]